VQGETLTVAEAAARLGVNDKTIRRWVKAGRLTAQLAPGPYGQQYRIPVEALQSAQQALAVVTVERGADSHALALAVAHALEPRDVALRGEIDQLHHEIGALRTLLEERLPMPVQGVQAPGHTPDSAVASQEPPEAPEPTPTTTTAVLPFLRRFWPLIVAVIVLVAAGVAVWVR
jgi:excisionase family DNA binding protein